MKLYGKFFIFLFSTSLFAQPIVSKFHIEFSNLKFYVNGEKVRGNLNSARITIPLQSFPKDAVILALKITHGKWTGINKLTLSLGTDKEHIFYPTNFSPYKSVSQPSNEWYAIYNDLINITEEYLDTGFMRTTVGENMTLTFISYGHFLKNAKGEADILVMWEVIPPSIIGEEH